MFNKVNRLTKALRDLKSMPYYLQSFQHYNNTHPKSFKVNLGQLQAENNRNKKITRLNEAEFQVFSQFGDDGIIQWLLSRIPFPHKTFIEFGVENYREANTRFLLINNYWSGLVMDGSGSNIKSIREYDIAYIYYDLQIATTFINAENINQLIEASGFPRELGILSIDIDGNDYWVWKAIEVVEPVVIICEYNSLFGVEQPYTIPYQPDFVRNKQYPMNFYGVSLRSACDLAESRGYCFAGCNSAGNNAYFVHHKYFPYLDLPALVPEKGYVFSSFTEAWDPVKNDWKKGVDKIRHIHGLPVYNTRSGELEKFDAESVIQSLKSWNLIPRL